LITNHWANFANLMDVLFAFFPSRGILMADFKIPYLTELLGNDRVATFECLWNSRVILFSVLKLTRRRF